MATRISWVKCSNIWMEDYHGLPIDPMNHIFLLTFALLLHLSVLVFAERVASMPSLSLFDYFPYTLEVYFKQPSFLYEIYDDKADDEFHDQVTAVIHGRIDDGAYAFRHVHPKEPDSGDKVG